jgi:hypothetical protein
MQLTRIEIGLCLSTLVNYMEVLITKTMKRVLHDAENQSAVSLVPYVWYQVKNLTNNKFMGLSI